MSTRCVREMSMMSRLDHALLLPPLCPSLTPLLPPLLGNPIAVWSNIFAGAKAGDGAVQESCYPYAIPTCPCNHHSLNSSLPKCPAEGKISTPTCDFTKKFACEDKGIFKADSVSLIPAANMEQELVENGPITVAYTVYDDFLTYKTGVYTKGADAKALGGHSVKIVGFGVDNATKMKYWTVANSWNAEWGDGGFFKIRRGTNVRDIANPADARELARPPILNHTAHDAYTLAY